MGYFELSKKTLQLLYNDFKDYFENKKLVISGSFYYKKIGCNVETLYKDVDLVIDNNRDDVYYEILDYVESKYKLLHIDRRNGEKQIGSFTIQGYSGVDLFRNDFSNLLGPIEIFPGIWSYFLDDKIQYDIHKELELARPDKPKYKVLRKFFESRLKNVEVFSFLRKNEIECISIDYEQYYCNPEIAKHLISLLDLSKYDNIIEPCAGDGSFSLQIPGCEAYDIDPHHPSIIKSDFLKLDFSYDPSETLIIGGPPFGKDSRMAFNFIQQASRFANTIAFILPYTFKEESHRKKGVPINFELIYETDLQENSFTVGGYPFSYPCVFQIYTKTL
ncbi:MAG TPA: hypothetical protein VMV43_03750 [Candidatus Nanopelagicaceae bacterium]|nr:hypothetical protein [Candidatus Nanopelagicaceae bacterium]